MQSLYNIIVYRLQILYNKCIKAKYKNIRNYVIIIYHMCNISSSNDKIECNTTIHHKYILKYIKIIYGNID